VPALMGPAVLMGGAIRPPGYTPPQGAHSPTVAQLQHGGRYEVSGGSMCVCVGGGCGGVCVWVMGVCVCVGGALYLADAGWEGGGRGI
jgi:hypothetical protein